MEAAGELALIWEEELADVPAWALVVQGLGVDLAIRSHLAFSGASTIKTFLLELAADEDWSRLVEVTPDHRAYGDGVLKDWPLPVRLPLRAVLHLMIAVSDNTATNVVADHLGGLEVVNDRLEGSGYRSRLRAWVSGRHVDPRRDRWAADPSLPSAAGLSVVVPAEHARCVARLVDSAPARELLLAQQDRTGLARHLRDDVAFAHKSGAVGGVRHDGGVLLPGTDEELHLHVFTDGPEREETVDDPACRAMSAAMDRTLRLLGLGDLLV